MNIRAMPSSACPQQSTHFISLPKQFDVLLNIAFAFPFDTHHCLCLSALQSNSLPSLFYATHFRRFVILRSSMPLQILTLPQQFMALLFLAIAGQHLTKLFNSIARPIQTEHCRSDANLHKTKPSPCFTKLSLRLALQSNSSPSPCRTLLHNAFAQSISSHLNLPLPLLRH